MTRPRRPIAITIIAWIMIGFGCVTLTVLLGPLVRAVAAGDPAEVAEFFSELWIPLLTRALAVVSGVFMLYGFDWARWLAVAWWAFLVGLAALHGTAHLVAHVVMFVVVLYLVLRPPAALYFRGAR